MFEPIRIGSLRGTISQVFHENNTPVYKGSISTQSENDIPVYAKPLNEDDIVRESICSKLGIAMGLPIPEPFVIHSDHQEFASNNGIGFASSALPFKSINVLVNRENASICENTLGIVLQELIAWPGFSASCLFDEWISNPDRNRGNILYGGNGKFHLIDHAESIPLSPAQMPAKNDLARFAVNQPKHCERVKKEIFENLLKSLMRIDSDELLKSIKSDLYHSAPKPFADYLTIRRNHLEALLKYNLNVIESQGELDVTH